MTGTDIFIVFLCFCLLGYSMYIVISSLISLIKDW